VADGEVWRPAHRLGCASLSWTGVESGRAGPEQRLRGRLNADPVVHCGTNALLGSQVALGSLDRQMPKEQLNLLELPAGALAQTGARATRMPHAAFSSLCRMPDYAESPCIAAPQQSSQ